ncbi:DUF420 domain-containing protein [Halobacteriales archaeon QS_8_69_26]|nr:MAG: DUF420 domain-containing protein [Halobacteriales archaeon QS_8_69_26]
MAIADRVRDRTRANPRVVTAVVTVVGYALVLGSFGGLVPLPEPSDATVLLLGDLIAVVNTLALAAILAGVWFVRRGEIRKHRAAMLTAFGLIMVFLVLYIWKQTGFTKGFVGPTLVTYAYWAMLAVHVLLSILAVPVVVHAVVLGLTHSIAELPETVHPRVGRIAVVAWSVSLALGILTYLLLNHVYAWERVSEAALLLAGTTGLADRRSRR